MANKKAGNKAKQKAPKAAKPKPPVEEVKEPVVEEVEVEEVSVDATVSTDETIGEPETTVDETEAEDDGDDDAIMETPALDAMEFEAAPRPMVPIPTDDNRNSLGKMLSAETIVVKYPVKAKEDKASKCVNIYKIIKGAGKFVRQYSFQVHGPGYKDLAKSFVNKFEKQGGLK